MATSESQEAPPENVLEEGDITILYRPRVNVEEAHSIDDVQRSFIIMAPKYRKDKKRTARQLIIPKKKLPDPRRHERFYGFTAAVSEDPAELLKDLQEGWYETKTRGQRHRGGARIAGEGVYQVVMPKDKRETRLVYELAAPSHTGAVQKALNIGESGCFIFMIRNPGVPMPQGQGMPPPPDFVHEEEKMRHFATDARWIDATDLSLLDYPRCQFLLIGASADLKGHVDPEDVEHLEHFKQQEIAHALKAAGVHEAADATEEEEARLVAELLSQIYIEPPPGVDATPLLEGEWK